MTSRVNKELKALNQILILYLTLPCPLVIIHDEGYTLSLRKESHKVHCKMSIIWIVDKEFLAQKFLETFKVLIIHYTVNTTQSH